MGTIFMHGNVHGKREREREKERTMGRNCLAKRRGSGANKWRVTRFGAHSLEQKWERERQYGRVTVSVSGHV